MKKTINTFFYRMANKMAHSKDVHILKTISRLIGLIVLALAFLLINDLYLIAGVFAVGLLIPDLIFMLLGKKESHYKDPQFFIRNHIRPKNLDRYTMTMNILKAVLLAPLFFLGQLHWYVIFFAFAPLFISILTGYKPYMPDGKHSTENGWNDVKCYGVAGYNYAGTYVGFRD
ncbi:MAG: hypothetical protein HRU43_00090 [Simkaniaceae bacterium]|nr:hypothetical protein [Simkaniaceae bacterium]